MYKACGNDILGIRDRAIAAFTMVAACAAAKAWRSTINGGKLKEKRLHIRKGKGNKERYVP